MRKYALKSLGISFLTVVAMALIVADAQAGEIQIEGSASLATGAHFTGQQLGVIKFLVPALEIYVECQELEVSEGTILSGPEGTGLGKKLFKKCKTHSNSGAELPCTIEDGGPVGLLDILRQRQRSKPFYTAHRKEPTC